MLAFFLSKYIYIYLGGGGGDTMKEKEIIRERCCLFPTIFRASFVSVSKNRNTNKLRLNPFVRSTFRRINPVKRGKYVFFNLTSRPPMVSFKKFPPFYPRARYRVSTIPSFPKIINFTVFLSTREAIVRVFPTHSFPFPIYNGVPKLIDKKESGRAKILNFPRNLFHISWWKVGTQIP